MIIISNGALAQNRVQLPAIAIIEFINAFVTAQPEGIGGVVIGGFAPNNHTPAHSYAGKLSSYMLSFIKEGSYG